MKIISYIYIIITISLLTLISCKKDCASITPSCELEPDSGPCRALIVKYYYDKEEGKCKAFEYGGCEGTVPFETMEECLECECD